MPDRQPRSPQERQTIADNLKAFETLEEMIDAMQEQERFAMENCHPMQRAITYGDHVVCQDVVPIWGRLAERQTTFGDADSEANEVDSHERGYRYGQWFSTMCPEGEWGSKHVFTCWPIKYEDFAHAEDNDWSLEMAVFRDTDWLEEFVGRLREQQASTGRATEEGQVDPNAAMRTRRQEASRAFACDICGGPVERGESYNRTVRMVVEPDHDDPATSRPRVPDSSKKRVWKTHLPGECNA